ncbi:MAG: penicillin-binding protein activator [Rhodospirillaceae bacterium]|nr:penicillin-binding protein activator [Rhodospirillaceae bacterium]
MCLWRPRVRFGGWISFGKLLPWGRAAVLGSGLLVLAACAGGARDVAPPKPQTQRPPAAAPTVPVPSAPTSTLQAPAPAAPALAPNQLILGITAAAPTAAPAGSPAAAPRPAQDALGLARVGLLVPLTGPSANVGQALMNAAQMALFDVADERFVLQVYDTQGTPEGAAQAAGQAMAHGARLLLGPLFSAEVKAVAPLASAASVNMVVFSTDPTVASNHVFVLGFLVQEQVRQILGYAKTQNLSRLAVLAPNSAYGQAAVEAVNRYAPARGLRVTQVVFYDPDGKNLNDVVRRLAVYDQRKRALEQQKAELTGKDDEISQLALKRLGRLETVGEVDFDAILIPDQGTRLTQAATLLPFFDIDPGRVQLLGTLLWDTPGLGREPVMIGGAYPAPAQDSNRQFFARYREFYGRTAPSIATHGYDAVALAAILARTGGRFSSEAVAANSGFAGVDGIFRFTPDGLSQRGFAVMQVTRDGATVVQPPPATFDAAQF